MPSSPLLISLPNGLSTSGITSWAVRLANTLVARGSKAGLILHAPPPHHAPLHFPLDPRVRLFDLSHLQPLSQTPGRVERFIPHYRDAIQALASTTPAILSPNLLGDDYAIAAALSQSLPDRLRIVGWLHNDIPYEYHLQRHYAPLISAFVPVSQRIHATLLARLPASRHSDIHRIPYGLDIPRLPTPRPPLAGRPLRLVYSGRLDESQKRVLCLPYLSRELTSRGIHHQLAILGDGPAAADLARLCAGIDHIHLCGPCTPPQVQSILQRADIFLLPSRHEGLSVAAIEALAQGCVPILTSLASGSDELVQPSVSGFLVPSTPDDQGQPLALAMADAVCHALPNLPALSQAAHARAQSLFSLASHADAVEALLRNVIHSPPRPWPTSQPCAFGGHPGQSHAASGSVPEGAAQRLTDLLHSLQGRRLLVHGTGRHTLELAGTFAAHGHNIVAFTDDDPAKHNTRLWGWPVLSPHDPTLPTLATDVIISSWINQAAILARRDLYERHGLQVHALYPHNTSTNEPEAPARVSQTTQRP
ncbi:MAG: glycosyltransferase [Tepidisphaera sp.]|nr:glycosyltransferase [Tepidisphaera sp.]